VDEAEVGVGQAEPDAAAILSIRGIELRRRAAPK
jgi:hypothetical protein